jgi:hypothetical protein
MKAAVIIAILAALAVAAFLYGVLAYVTRGYIQQDRQADATAPCEPVDPCETCNRWDECNGVDREYCPLWRANEEENHGKGN